MIRKVLVQSLKILISGFLIGFLLHRIGWQRVVEHLRSADIYWLVGALVLFTASNVIGSYQWWLLLRSEGIWIGWKKTLSFYFVGLFFNNFLITNLGGDLFRMIDVRRYSKNGSGAVSTVFLDRFVGLFVMSSMAVLAASLLMIRGDIRSAVRPPIIVFIVGWVLLIFFLFNKRFVRPFAWLIQWTIPEGIAAKAKEVYQKIYSFGRQKKLLFRIVSISLVVQSARVMTHYLLGRSLGITISPFYFFLFIPIVAIIANLPVSLGGIGLREQTGVILFGGVGVMALQAFSMEFLAYLVAIGCGVPGGIVFVCRRRVETGRTDVLQKEIEKGRGQ